MKPIQARRVLVPIDFSPFSLKALPLARQLAAKGARIVLFHVVEPVMTVAYAYGPEGAVPVYDRHLTRRKLVHEQRQLDRIAAGVKGASAVTVEARQVYKAVVSQASRGNYDLLVLSTHGRSGISKLLYGSMAQRILSAWKGETVLIRPRMG